jgi:superfamily II DNA helicase RecQ
MVQVLQHITGQPVLQLHRVQAPVLKAIQDSTSPVVIIMPIGSSKSMLFILPAYTAPGGCIIIVVPLLLLRADLIIYYQALGILYMLWESYWPPDKAVIMLVIPELTKNPDFYIFLNCQQQI